MSLSKNIKTPLKNSLRHEKSHFHFFCASNEALTGLKAGVSARNYAIASTRLRTRLRRGSCRFHPATKVTGIQRRRIKYHSKLLAAVGGIPGIRDKKLLESAATSKITKEQIAQFFKKHTLRNPG